MTANANMDRMAEATALDEVTQVEPRPGESALALHVALSALACLVVTIIWLATGAGYLWPAWVWLAAGVAIAVHAAIRRTLARPDDPRRGLELQAMLTAIVPPFTVAAWALTGGGYFWPIWTVLFPATLLGVHAALVLVPERRRERALAERVDELTRTRSGALDVQAAELRRIERDLHDGAQARLVALSMLIGRAEDRLADRPEVAALVRDARNEAAAAISELRDLARGIAPPVLADRGLEAAVEAVARRSPMPVTVEASLAERPPPVVETAAYFVVAESLTNVAKHAGGASARVEIADRHGRLAVAIADDGPGGADPHGAGLTGLRHRVEALDGELTVTSADGVGTTVNAELPCGP
jgi:signal transduction histidine kinase